MNAEVTIALRRSEDPQPLASLNPAVRISGLAKPSDILPTHMQLHLLTFIARAIRKKMRQRRFRISEVSSGEVMCWKCIHYRFEHIYVRALETIWFL